MLEKPLEIIQVDTSVGEHYVITYKVGGTHLKSRGYQEKVTSSKTSHKKIKGAKTVEQKGQI